VKAPASERRPLPQWVFWLAATLLVPVIFFAFGFGAGFSDAHREDSGEPNHLGYAPAGLLGLAWVACIARGALGLRRDAAAGRWPGWLVLLITLAVASAAGSVMALLAALLDSALLNAALRGVLLLVVTLLTWVYWRRIDEAAREAQKSAWLWGSCGGLALLATVEPLVARPDGGLRAPLLFGDGSPHDWLLTGAAYLFLAQAVAATLFWGAWWIRAR